MINPIVIKNDDYKPAADAIASGKLVAFGTETVYGLGGNALDDHAVARIFAAKNRPSFNPLISHVPDLETAFTYGIETPLARKLAEAFWPGPMTLIMDKAEGCPISDLATASLNTIAIRVPSKAQARAFLKACGIPIAAPSANRSGRVSPTLAAHVTEELGMAEDLAMILDFGPSENGLESTVIDARGGKIIILRPGSITQALLSPFAPVAEVGAEMGVENGIISPGQQASHYAPEKPVALNITAPEDGDIHIGFGESNGMINLSSNGDLIEAAANLYQSLRSADKCEGRRITIAPIPDHGLGHAINDRLSRAATSR